MIAFKIALMKDEGKRAWKNLQSLLLDLHAALST